MILHSDREGNDCIRKLRCHCIQIMHSDIYSVGIGFAVVGRRPIRKPTSEGFQQSIPTLAVLPVCIWSSILPARSPAVHHWRTIPYKLLLLLLLHTYLNGSADRLAVQETVLGGQNGLQIEVVARQGVGLSQGEAVPLVFSIEAEGET